MLGSRNSRSMVDHAEGKHAGGEETLYTYARKYTHTHACTYTPHKHTHKHHHPEVLHDWEVIKEAQRSVKVKGQRSNQSGVKH